MIKVKCEVVECEEHETLGVEQGTKWNYYKKGAWFFMDLPPSCHWDARFDTPQVSD